MNKNKNEDIQQFFTPKIAVLGLGYVGLPLFCLFSKHYHCVGFDSDNERTTLLSRGIDAKRCEKEENINAAIRNSIIVSNSNAIRDCNVFVICVPTGVTSSHEPDLFPLKSACFVVGSNLKKGDLVIFESTVFPGATDEICIPILEEYSGLTLNIDFGVGYSPERINVGEEIHHLSITPKIISGSSSEVLNKIEKLYSSIISAPLCRASSIKVAEAAKMYENVQCDTLIALANEFSLYCGKERIDSFEVTRCASTKWNFASIYPGLVGGHCIGIDPYYLIERAKSKSLDLPLVSTARCINENETFIVIKKISDLIGDKDCSILILGASYKANISDIRNSKSIEIIKRLHDQGVTIMAFDPIIDTSLLSPEIESLFIKDQSELILRYDIVIKLVNHSIFDKFNIRGTISTLELKDLI